MKFPKTYDHDFAEVLRLMDYPKYLEYVNNEKILTKAFINRVAKKYQKHYMDPKNVLISNGTINAIFYIVNTLIPFLLYV